QLIDLEPANAVLGAETASMLAHHIVNGALDPRSAGEKWLARGVGRLIQVEMEIAIPHVTVGNEPPVRHVLLHPLRGALHECGQAGDGDGNIVLEASAIEP